MKQEPKFLWHQENLSNLGNSHPLVGSVSNILFLTHCVFFCVGQNNHNESTLVQETKFSWSLPGGNDWNAHDFADVLLLLSTHDLACTYKIPISDCRAFSSFMMIEIASNVWKDDNVI